MNQLMPLAYLFFTILLSCENKETDIEPYQGINPFIHTKGTEIVKGDESTIYFKGVQIEGWLSVPSHVWGAGLSGETKIYEGIKDLVGAEKALGFRKDVVENFITKKDIEAIHNAGFNLVRVPVNHIALDFYNDGWPRLDSLFNWCEEYNVYVMLSMHSAPSPQNNLFYCDYNFPEPTLWDFNGKRDETILLWKKIAIRYKEEMMLAGYDLLNEPNPPGISKNLFVDLYNDIIKEIRNVDQKHMILIEGSNFAKDFSFFSTPFSDNNICFEFHTYNWFGENLQSQLESFKTFALKNNAPIINGEFGVATNNDLKIIRENFENKSNLISGWVFWTWKAYYLTEGNWLGGVKNKDIRYVREVSISPEWLKVIKYVSGELFAPKPSTDETLKGMEDFINSIKIENTEECTPLLQSLGL